MRTQRVQVTSAKGTIYFVREADGLKQGYDLTIRNYGRAFHGRLRASWGKCVYESDLGGIDKGESVVRAYIPDLRMPARITFELEGADGASITVKHRPQRHWTVHLIQFAHHDPGYTDLPSNVFREMATFYDDLLCFCAETDHFPDDSRFRYTIEQGYSLLYFLEHRPPEVREEMIRRIREGCIEVNAFLANEVTELLGPEEMVRMMYPVFALKREYGIPVLTAEHNDIPGISWGVASALAGAGIRYFSPALPDYFRWGERYRTFWDEDQVCPGGIPHAFYWAAPTGEKVLFWYGRQGAGGPVDVTLSGLPAYLEELEATAYPYDVLRYHVLGGERDNAPPRVEFAYTCREWNARWAYPKLVQSLNSRFFPELEKQLRPDTPTWRGELPGTDYSAAASCTAYPSSLNRVTHDRLLAAERFAAIASETTPYEYPAEAFGEAYFCTLMNDEHAWGLAHPTGPGQDACIAQHCEYAYRAAALAQDALEKSVNEIADHIGRDEDGYYAVVFNPLNWRRTDLAVAAARPMQPCAIWMRPVPRSADDAPAAPAILRAYPVSNRGMVGIPMELIRDGLEVIDVSTGETVPHEVYEVTGPQAPVPYAAYRYSLGQHHEQEKYDVRFVARDVPAMGYKLYRFAPAKKRTLKGAVRIESSSLENAFYRVELDPKSGALRSIFDKELGRELVDREADHLANQLVLRSSITAEVVSSGKASVEKGRCAAVSGSLIVKTEAPGYPQITQEIILYSELKRIDIANRLLKDSTPHLETFFAFPFDFDSPIFKYEGSLSVIEPLADQFPGSNTEYYAIQHWADVSDAKCGATLVSIDAPMMQFGGNWPLYISQAHHGFRPPNFEHPFHTRDDIRKGHLYSFVLLNNYRTNFTPFQVGDLLFRYSITSHAGGWKEGRARDFGYGASMPLIHAGLKGPHGGDLPASASWCEVHPENVLLLALKRAEDGRGFVIRLLETEGVDTEASVKLTFVNIQTAWETNLVEENQRVASSSPHEVRVPLKAWGTATLRVE